MRIVRFTRSGRVGYGIYEDDYVHVVHNPFSPKKTGKRFDIHDMRLLCPMTPSKIVCAGLNYVDHAAEMNMPIPDEPVIFLKPPSSALDPGGTIIYPDMAHQVDHEAELAVVIGAVAKDVSCADAPRFILGYTCFNDVTARDLQRRDSQWTRAKSFDTFGPFGPWVETDIDPTNVRVEAFLNGETRQSSSTANLIFPVVKLVSFISKIMTLLPGDIIATGTPPGIGPMKVGDEIEVRISGIGGLINRVAAAAPAA